jgi:hypothetical protein
MVEQTFLACLLRQEKHARHNAHIHILNFALRSSQPANLPRNGVTSVEHQLPTMLHLRSISKHIHHTIARLLHTDH